MGHSDAIRLASIANHRKNGPMSYRFQFDTDILNSVAGGRSAIDMAKLQIHSLEEANSFLLAYGFDYQNEKIVDRLWYFHRRAIVLMTEKLRFQLEEIPEIIREPKKLQDIRMLLLYASTNNPDEKDLQKWACALLRCMHVFVHAEQDLFSFFSEEIQQQILAPIQKHIVHEGVSHRPSLVTHDAEPSRVDLMSFQIKPFKTSTSSVIKLLAKPDALAMRLFDKLGLRFVTKNIFDSFRVIRFLAEEHIISFPHIMPDQSTNTIYPVDLFLKNCEELIEKNKEYSEEEVEAYFIEKLAKIRNKIQFVKKENVFSGEDFHYIKFICRKLIHIQPPQGKDHFSFFYPFEVQILDDASYQRSLTGESDHSQYKDRQILAARQRLFPEVQVK